MLGVYQRMCLRFGAKIILERQKATVYSGIGSVHISYRSSTFVQSPPAMTVMLRALSDLLLVISSLNGPTLRDPQTCPRKEYVNTLSSFPRLN